MQPDKVADGLFQFLPAGAARPALRKVRRYFRAASRRQLAIRCQQKFFIREMRFVQHSSPLLRADKARQRSCQRNGYGSEGQIENLSDFAICETLGAKRQAAPVLLGKSPQDGLQTRVPLVLSQLIFGIQLPVD
jgi:hypothetical protein